MYVTRIRAADFRNLTFADVEFDAKRVFLLGDNGQGKTNLLEAAGLLSTFRSFRTNEITPLIREGCTEARVRIDTENADEKFAVEIRLAKGSRKGHVNQTAVTSVADHLGKFPTIVFCSDDLRLIRGSPSNRRRWLDAAIGSTDANYLSAIRDYQRALEGRNALLKIDQPQDDSIRAFEKVMLPAAILITQLRAKALPEIAQTLRETCDKAGFPNKAAEIVYKADTSTESLADAWQKNRGIDIASGTTQRGPHKDDFDILFGGQNAADYASEGQQRLLALALSLGRLKRDAGRSSTPPVILADDVLGELDETRQKVFWQEVGDSYQVIATGTTPPPSGNWLTYRVSSGSYHRQ